MLAIINSKLDFDPSALNNGAADHFVFRLCINASATLRFTSDAQAVALLEVALSSTTEMRADGVVVSLSVDEFQMIDECSENPLTRYLIVSIADTDMKPYAKLSKGIKGYHTSKSPVNPFSVSQKREKSERGEKDKGSSLSLPSESREGNVSEKSNKPVPKLQLVIDSRNGKSLLRLSVRPLEATWNELCVGRLLGIFLSPLSPTSTPNVSTFSPKFVSSMRNFTVDTSLPVAGEMELIIEIDAPNVIIPDDCTVDKGCLLFKPGFLVIKGIML